MSTRAESRTPPVPSAVLATALLLVTEVMLFCGLVSAYLVLRGQAVQWPPPDQPRLPAAVTGMNSGVLLASGVLAWRSLAATPAGGRPASDGARAAARSLAGALGLGLAFLAVQGAEWVRLIGHGLTGTSSVYGGIFYAIVGTHAVHVVAGALALGWALGRARRGALPIASLRAVRLYWTFVVLVWPVLWVLVYLW